MTQSKESIIKPETPATGVYKTNDFGDCVFYTVACDCEDAAHFHDLMVEVEADDMHVSVNISTWVSTEYKYKIFNNHGFFVDLINGIYSRFRNIVDILWYGKTEHEATIFMDEQTTINYSNILKQATEDVKNFRKQRRKK